MHTRSYELIVLIESAKGIKSSRTRRKRLLIACEIDSIARKFKTKIERNTEDPVFNEFKAFSIEREEFDLLAVRVSVWDQKVRFSDHGGFLENVFWIRGRVERSLIDVFFCFKVRMKRMKLTRETRVTYVFLATMTCA